MDWKEFFNICWTILYYTYVSWLFYKIFRAYYKRIEFKKKYPYAYNEIKFNLFQVKCRVCENAITTITEKTKVSHIIKRLYQHQHNSNSFTHRPCVFDNELKLICKLEKRDYR